LNATPSILEGSVS